MPIELVRDVLLGIAAIPFIYYALAIFSTVRFFNERRPSAPGAANFQPPVSNLKPVRGLDPDAYENFASFCRQDYPEYEIVFSVGDTTDPVLPVLQRLIHDFPQSQIRILIGHGRDAVHLHLVLIVLIGPRIDCAAGLLTQAPALSGSFSEVTIQL